jgi:hypothetical protein
LGVTKVGEVAKTNTPLPVSLVIAEAKLALDGVPKNVATPVPSPLTPVEIGSPVAFVRTPAEGVPKLGVTKVGEVNKLVIVSFLFNEVDTSTESKRSAASGVPNAGKSEILVSAKDGKPTIINIKIAIILFIFILLKLLRYHLLKEWSRHLP